MVIDEYGVNLKQGQRYARAIIGNRIKLPIPFIRVHKYSIIGAITCTKVLAAMYGQWATNTEIFSEFVEYHLCPNLKPYHVVALDNIAFHHNNHIQSQIKKNRSNYNVFTTILTRLLAN